jgi:hypothetical protein
VDAAVFPPLLLAVKTEGREEKWLGLGKLAAWMGFDPAKNEDIRPFR